MPSALSEQEIQDAAEELILAHNEDYEFSLVYEDEEYSEVSEEDQEKIYRKMLAAKVTVIWD